MACLLLLLALTFCEPEESYLSKQYVDYSVGLYFREYHLKDQDITTVYQLASVDLKDDTIETLPMPFMVTINGRPYLVACWQSRCWLQGY